MKYLDKYQLVTLEDNKKYVVIDSIIHEDNNFVYLINTKDIKDQLMALVSKENDIINIDSLDYQSEDNKELINTLSDKFINSIANINDMGDLIGNE